MQYLGFILWFIFIGIAVFGTGGFFIFLGIMFSSSLIIAFIMAHFTEKRDQKRHRKEVREAIRTGKAIRHPDNTVEWLDSPLRYRHKYDFDLDGND